MTVAVNWWRDMSFGPQYVLLQFLRTLTVRPPSLEAAFAREATPTRWTSTSAVSTLASLLR